MELTKEKIKQTFFQNIGLRQTILKNTFWLGFSRGVGKVLKLCLLIYVARLFGPLEYGKFSFALAFIGLFAFIPNFVFPSIVIREFSKNKDKDDFSSVLILRIIFNIVSLIIISIVSFFITKDPIVQSLIFILAIYIQIESISDFLSLFFQAKQKMEYQSVSEILRSIMLLVITVLVVFKYPSIQGLGVGYLISSIFSLVVVLFIFHTKVYSLSFNLHKETWKKYLIFSWPLALSALFSSLLAKGDSVIMGSMNLLSQTGWYNAALKIASGIAIPVIIFETAFYPALNRAYSDGAGSFKRAWDFQINILIFLLIPFSAGFFALATKLINFFYNPDYVPSILAFQIIMFSIVFSVLSKPFIQVLYILNKQIYFVWINFATAVFNLLLNFILIPRFGLYGAAWASLVTYALLLPISIFVSNKFLKLEILKKKFFVTLLASCSACLVAYYIGLIPTINNLHLVLVFAISASAYLFMFFIIKSFTKSVGFAKEIL